MGLRSVLAALLVLGVAAADVRPEEPSAADRLIEDLLRLPAPLPPWEEVSKATRRPGPTVADEALRALEESPQSLGQYVRRLPPRPDTVARVAALHEADRKEPKWPPEDRRTVLLWLMAHSDAYRAELLVAATRDREALEVLVERDWPTAAEILRTRLRDRDAAVRAHALAQLYRHAESDEQATLRTQLCSLAADPGGTTHERVLAFTALKDARWEDETAWVLGRFSDASLQRLEHDNTVYHPLQWIVARDPDRWIPLIVPFVGGPDVAAHDNAVACLAQFHDEKARPDALRPLRPWVADPGWSSAGRGDMFLRNRVLRSLRDAYTEEDVPMLVARLDVADEWEIDDVAEILERLGSEAAAPALRRALDRLLSALPPEEERYDLGPVRAVLGALVRCGGMTKDEVLAHVEAWALAEGGTPTAGALLGSMLVRSAPEEDLLARAALLETAHPKAAAHLRAIVDRAGSRTAVRRLFDRLSAKTIDADGVRWLLDHREDIRRDHAALIAAASKDPGLAGGVAAVLGTAEGIRREILRNGTGEARRALLACARLLRESLPLHEVIALLPSGDAVSQAADRYLEAEDSPAARAALLARGPGTARILGLRGYCPVSFDDREEALRRDVLSDGGPEEVFALLSAGVWGDDGQWIVRRRGNRLEVTHEPRRQGGDSGTWTLSAVEWAGVSGFLRSEGIDDLPPYDPTIFDGMQYEYVHLTRAGGRRVVMNNPGSNIDRNDRSEDVYARLVRVFQELRRTRPR